MNNINNPLIAKYKFSTVQKGTNSLEYSRIVKIKTIPFEEKDIFAFQLLCEKYNCKNAQDSLFSKQIGSVFSNVIVLANANGEIVNYFSHKQIQKKWQIVKKSLLNDYNSYNMYDFIQKTDTFLNNRKAVISFLASDKMYGLFFNKQWKTINAIADENNKNLQEITLSNLPEYLFIFQGTLVKEITKQTPNHLYKMLCLGII